MKVEDGITRVLHILNLLVCTFNGAELIRFNTRVRMSSLLPLLDVSNCLSCKRDQHLEIKKVLPRCEGAVLAVHISKPLPGTRYPSPIPNGCFALFLSVFCTLGNFWFAKKVGNGILVVHFGPSTHLYGRSSLVPIPVTILVSPKFKVISRILLNHDTGSS